VIRGKVHNNYVKVFFFVGQFKKKFTLFWGPYRWGVRFETMRLHTYRNTSLMQE
jgi:hypothetical protein